MQQRHRHREQYFNELVRSSRKFFLADIARFKSFEQPLRVLEVGCGEGGILVPFAEHGCFVWGIDLCQEKILMGQKLFEGLGLEATLESGDIFQAHYPSSFFDVIILHDVIEHIEDKLSLIRQCLSYLRPTGLIYIGFPAWQMPFGGHQQAASSVWVCHTPLIHLLPRGIYRRVLRLLGEPKSSVQELLYIHRTRCSIEQFEAIVKQLECRIAYQQLYLINPHYETKFGLRARRLSRWIGSIPYVRNFFSTSCIYILTR